MKTTILLCGIGLCVAVMTSGAFDRIAKVEKKICFQDTPREAIASILPNLDPQSETPLAVNENSNIVAVANWWLNRVLEPAYVPPMEFITQNIELYPANSRHPEDIAALSFAIGGNRYQRRRVRSRAS